EGLVKRMVKRNTILYPRLEKDESLVPLTDVITKAAQDHRERNKDVEAIVRRQEGEEALGDIIIAKTPHYGERCFRQPTKSTLQEFQK
ncbi:MAG: hypothetical protein Q9228_008038, partial [Teloschistes exilis]